MNMSINEFLVYLNANRFQSAAIILFVVGMCGMLFNRNLFKKVISMGFMDDAIFLFLTSSGYVEGHIAPIVTDTTSEVTTAVYSNPLPAGLVLTGIVVSVSFTAFSLALTQRLYKKYGTLNIDEIMMSARKDED